MADFIFGLILAYGVLSYFGLVFYFSGLSITLGFSVSMHHIAPYYMVYLLSRRRKAFSRHYMMFKITRTFAMVYAVWAIRICII